MVQNSSILLIFGEIICQCILEFKMLASIVTERYIDSFTPIVIQSEQLIQNNCIRIHCYNFLITNTV